MEDDWKGAVVTWDHGQRIIITHPDEAALGRINMQIIALIQGRLSVGEPMEGPDDD